MLCQVIVAEGQHPSLHGAKLYSYKEAEAGGHSYWISAQVRPEEIRYDICDIYPGDAAVPDAPRRRGDAG